MAPVVTCRRFDDELEALLDARVPEPARAGLEAHAAACARCAAALSRGRAVRAALRAMGPAPVPAGLAASSFRAAMSAPAAPSFLEVLVPLGLRISLATVAAAAAFLVLAPPSVPADGAFDAVEAALAVDAQTLAADILGVGAEGEQP